MSTPSCTPLLDVRDLRVTLQTAHGWVQALRGVNLRMERGQTLGLIGESGCGKSLTALAIMGLLPERAQVAGTMIFNGTSLVGMPESEMCQMRGARMAMIFQEPMTALNPVHPIWKQIAEPLRLHQNMDLRVAKAHALALLERVQLPRAPERLEAYPHQLSGGQRQRVMIAIALACGPDLLIADEPTTALDVTVQKEVLALIRQLVAEDGMGLLLISHDLGLMREQVERVMVMYGGSVVESAATEELFAQRAHPYTRGLFAARPRLGMARGSRLATIAGSVPEMVNLPTGCAFADRCPISAPVCHPTRPNPELLTPRVASLHPHEVSCPRWQITENCTPTQVPVDAGASA
ncbi:MAG: ABC transporter ATP-binding protein [Betaproteobacteria bacterium]|nr:ABC transporter ATP-binding protein [Betaproteobacteria bacterium]